MGIRFRFVRDQVQKCLNLGGVVALSLTVARLRAAPHGMPGARSWSSVLSERSWNSVQKGAAQLYNCTAGHGAGCCGTHLALVGCLQQQDARVGCSFAGALVCRTLSRTPTLI